MSEAQHAAKFETGMQLTPVDLIPDIDLAGSLLLEDVIVAAQLDPSGRQLWAAVTALEESPQAILRSLRSDELKDDEFAARNAVLTFGEIVSHATKGRNTTASFLSRLSPLVQDVMSSFDPSFKVYRDRVHASRQKGLQNNPAYQPYMNTALIIGLALFAARNPKPPAVQPA